MKNSDFSPRIFNAGTPSGQSELKALRDSNNSLIVSDTIESQLKDLLKSLSPSERLNEKQLETRMYAFLNERPLEHYGNWVYYPWSNRLVHLLPERAFESLRTNRNKLKLTKEEQDQLSTKKIGLVGLSVGHAAAMTLAMERSFGTLRIADFDELDLSNLNRIRSGVHNIGTPKTTITAQDIAELDPYLSVETYAEGVTTENIDAFLDGLDILIDECDSLDIKMLLREKARERGIAVVMETSDRGMLDIERFDLDASAPIFHGLAKDLKYDELSGLTNEEKIPYIHSIVGLDKSSERLKLSMKEVGKSISTWPQLGADVMSGGASVAYAVRTILLGGGSPHGRYYLEMDKLFSVSDTASYAVEKE